MVSLIDFFEVTAKPIGGIVITQSIVRSVDSAERGSDQEG